MAIAITLKDFLDSEGVRYDLVEHPYAVTSLEIADEAHVSGEKLVKTVVLNDGVKHVLAVVPATHHIQLGRMRKQYDRFISLSSETDINELFYDCDLGAAPPIGRAYDIDVIYDDSLLGCEDVYFEAGDHRELVHVAGDDFIRLLGGASHSEISTHL